MNVLILGAEGIAGSALMRTIPEARGTTRRATPIDPRILPGIDIASRSDIETAFDIANPSVVVNCAGIVKSECDKCAPDYVHAVNANAPHVIAEVAAEYDARVIHLSTDCVFDGSRGERTETEPPDAADLYGRTKAEGELVVYDHCLTLRVSFIGRDPLRGRGLLEWLLTQRDEVAGYVNMLWSGLSACELARAIVARAIPSKLSGLFQVAGPVISKADLLKTLIAAHGLPLRVRRVGEPRIDRTLDGSRFRRATGYAAPSWSEMAKELACPT